MAVAAVGVGAWMAANAGTIAAVSTAASVAATSYSVYSQQQAAKAESQAQSEQNQEIAKQAAASYDDLSPAEIDANKQANEAALQQQAEALQAKGRVNLFASASGTMGGSVDSLLYDIDTIRDRNINNVITQRESGLLSIRQKAEQIRQSAISGQSSSAISSPSWIEGGLKIGNTLVNSASNYSTQKKTTDLLNKANTNQVKGGV